MKATGSDKLRSSRGATGVPVEAPLGAADTLVVDDRTRSLIESRRTGKTHRRGWVVVRSLVIADAVAILTAFAAAEMIFHKQHVDGRFGVGAEIGAVRPLDPGLAAAREDLRALQPRRGTR